MGFLGGRKRNLEPSVEKRKMFCHSANRMRLFLGEWEGDGDRWERLICAKEKKRGNRRELQRRVNGEMGRR